MRARGLFLCPPKNTPHPPRYLSSPRGAPQGSPSPSPCVTMVLPPAPQPPPAEGQGRAPPARTGTAWGEVTVTADEATRRTFNAASDSEHSSISAKQQRKSSSRETNSNDIEHSTLRHGHAELSDATKQREESSTLQATANTTRRREHNSEATRQSNAKNIQHQQHDATRM